MDQLLVRPAQLRVDDDDVEVVAVHLLDLTRLLDDLFELVVLQVRREGGQTVWVTRMGEQHTVGEWRH